MDNIITVFKNIHDTDTPFHRPVSVALSRIKNGDSKERIEQIQNIEDKKERDEIKKLLPSICFSGKFTRRADNALVEHSGLICLDFDAYSNKSIMLEHKSELSSDEYVFSVFISPSGKGLKVLVKIPAEPDHHVDYFLALKKHFNSENFDDTSKNVSRVCYESYDPMIYINEDSKIWTKKEEKKYKEVNRAEGSKAIPLTDKNKVADILVKWWKKEYPMTEGNRNNNAYLLAMSFNEFGIDRSLAVSVLSDYIEQGFPESEVKQVVNSAYGKREKWNTKFYEDDSRMNNIRNQIKNGTGKKHIRHQLEEDGIDDEIIESAMRQAEEDTRHYIFWTKSDKGVVKIIPIKFKDFLEEHGFYKYSPEGSMNHVFVRIINNLIDHTTEKEIKDFVLEYLIELEDLSIYNYFAEQTKFFKEEFLTLLATVDVFFKEDTKNAGYLYFENCAVKVTAKGTEVIDYIDLNGYVWKDQIIPRIYSECEVHKNFEYKKFIANISHGDKARIKSMESTIGFLLHQYKNPSFCPAIVLNDEVISDNPEGGTGKGLFMNGLSQMKKLVTIDGKRFSFDSSFSYQLVSADTQILCFDDVKKHFDFERLFSVVTEGLTLEKKNKDAIKLPFEKSPKVAITTNYAIKGAGNSFERRKWELELHQYYRKDFTPRDEFGRLMFGEWDDDDWCNFDNYMISCLMLYLKEGLVRSKFVNLKVRKLSAETCHDFIEWCGLVSGSEENTLLKVGKKIYKEDLFQSFTEEYPDYEKRGKMALSRQRFSKWLKSYAFFSEGVDPDEGRDSTGRWIIIKKKPNPEDLELPF